MNGYLIGTIPIAKYKANIVKETYCESGVMYENIGKATFEIVSNRVGKKLWNKTVTLTCTDETIDTLIKEPSVRLTSLYYTNNGE